MIYLASPYTHSDPAIMELRYKWALEAVVRLMRKRISVYSPIVHNHFVAQAGEFPKGFDFWERFDLEMVSLADELWVLQIEGWEKSHGVQAELKHAYTSGIPCRKLFVKDNSKDGYCTLPFTVFDSSKPT